MILCDAGPLVSLASVHEETHPRCVEIWSQLREPIITTWVCVGEAMYLVGPLGQQLLWLLLDQKSVQYFDPGPAIPRMRSLMRKYADAPMDLGDATLVVAAEELNVRRIFTLDQHFYSYQIHDRTPFDVIR